MKHVRTVGLIIIILFSLVFPLLIGDETTATIAIEVLLLTGAAAAWNIFSGYTGYISLGHATYFGIGSYTLVILCQRWNVPGEYGPFLLVPFCGLIAGVFALPLGWIALHARRFTFMVITLAFFFIFQLLSYNLHDLTGGSSGMFLPAANLGDDNSYVSFYYASLAIVLLVVFISWRIQRSRYGLLLKAMRDDEDRAQGLGLKTSRYKLVAYLLSAFFIGIIGGMSAFHTGFISPLVAFDKTFDLTIAVSTFIGGMGTVAGPIVGSLFIQPLQVYLSIQFTSFASGLNSVLFGGALLVVIMLFPEGVVTTLRRRWSLQRTSPTRQQPEQEPLTVLQPLSTASVSVVNIAMTNAILASPTLQPMSRASVPHSGSLEVDEIPSQRHSFAPTSTNPSLTIPRRISELPIPSQASRKIKSLQLESLSPHVSQTSSSSSWQITAASPVSWRCPNCQKPFLLKGNLCYCPRCGITRSVTARQ